MDHLFDDDALYFRRDDCYLLLRFWQWLPPRNQARATSNIALACRVVCHVHVFRPCILLISYYFIFAPIIIIIIVIMGNSVSLEDELINLRLTSKQMQNASKKCDKNEKAAVNKVKKVDTCEISISIS